MRQRVMLSLPAALDTTLAMRFARFVRGETLEALP